jgi:ComEC/Rec2-related protein
VDLKLQVLASADSLYVRPTLVRIYLAVPPDSILPAPGEHWQLAGRLESFRNNGNPGETDYRTIMARKGYWYRFFADSGPGMYKRVERKWRSGISPAAIRASVSARWDGDDAAVSLLSAVCLGDRTGLTDDLRQAYAAAGGMHLLAVSGLHVGLIWWVLHHAFSIWVRLWRREIYRALPILILLWLYAFVTGFSSSVCRSVTMFTLVSLSRLIDQRTNAVNAILVSAFLLILTDPGKLSEVGFQLSYAAVLGIVTLYPWIRALPGRKIRNRIIRWAWEGTGVSLSAQLATAPLVIYYFHQLPVYALFTSLAAIPLLSLLIALFVLWVPLLALAPVASALGRIMVFLGTAMNRFMEWIAGIPGAVIAQIDLDPVAVVMTMAFLMLAVVSLRCRSNWPRYGLLLVAAGHLCWGSVSVLRKSRSSEFMIAHFYGGSLVIMREGSQVDCYLSCRDSSVHEWMDQYISMVWEGPEFQTRRMRGGDTLDVRGQVSAFVPAAPGIGMVGNDRMKGWMVCRTAERHHMDLIEKDPGAFVLLCGEPRIPASLTDGLPAGTALIVDGSNRKWYVEQIAARDRQLYATSYNGAYRKTW